MVACAEILTAERKGKKLYARCELYLENCGYRYNAETENYYVRNRYSSPTLGRWLTRDPIGYQGGINLYGFVNSSPVGNNVDAEGTQVFMYRVAVDNTPDGQAAAPARPPPAGPVHFLVPHGYSVSAARAERDRLFGELQIMRRLYLSDENAIARAGCPYPNLWPSGGPPKKPGLKLLPGTAGAVGEVVGEAVQEIIFASAGI